MNEDWQDIVERLAEFDDADSPEFRALEARLASALRDAESSDPAAAVDEAGLTRRVLTATAPELARNASRAWADRLLRALVVALVPLPVAIAVAGWGLPRLYDVLATLMPPPIAAALVTSYAALGLAAVATAYACLPVLTERMGTPAFAPAAAGHTGAAAPGGDR